MDSTTFNFQDAIKNGIFLLSGLGLTLKITLFSLIGAVVIGLVAALLRISRIPGIAHLARLYVDFFRCTPALVQLVWLYYALPISFGFDLSAFSAAVVTLSLNMGAFLSEIFRAGIQSIDKGQREAAFVLGMSYWQSMQIVVLPQAIARVLPPIGSSMIVLVKDSSLASFIAVPEMTYQGQILQAATFRPVEVLTVVAVIYFVLNYPLTLVVRYLENRSARAR